LKIDVINAELPKQLLELVRNVYQHEQTNRHTRHAIRFELQRVLGKEYDVIGFLNSKEPL